MMMTVNFYGDSSIKPYHLLFTLKYQGVKAWMCAPLLREITLTLTSAFSQTFDENVFLACDRCLSKIYNVFFRPIQF